MKPLLVGEACNVPGGEPFCDRSGAFLAGLIGMTLAEFAEAFNRVNLLRRWPGRSGGVKGHLFDLEAATRAARRLDLTGRTAVLAGKRVARAFGLRHDVEWMTPVELGRSEAAAFVIPHPSGIVR